MKEFLFTFLFTSLFTVAFSQDKPLLVENVSPLEVINFTSFQGQLFFAKDDTIFTATPASTGTSFFAKLNGEQVVEMGTRTAFNFEEKVRFPTTSDHIFFITASTDGTTPNYNLWWSDGTPTNTAIIFSADTLFGFTTFNNTMYFIAETQDPTSYGRELHRIEANGDIIVLTDHIMPGEGSSIPEYARVIAGQNYMYFTGRDLEHGRELWQSAGNQNDATLVADLTPGPDSTEFGDMALAGTTLYFVDTRFYGPDTLFAYDGTDLSVLVESEYDVIREMVTFNNSVLFTLSIPGTSATDTDLYITQGVPGDTVLLGAFPSNLSYFIPVGNHMFFARHLDGNPWELYKTDGTPEGTTSFNGSFAAGEVDQREFAQVGNLVFFTEFETEGFQLAQTDLTTEGTATVQALTNSNEPYGNATKLTEVDGALFFVAELNNNEFAIFYYDPAVVTSSKKTTTEAATFSVYPNPASSDLTIKADLPGRVTILNQVSQVVMQQEVTDTSVLSVTHLPAGIYFVQFITEGNDTSIRKFIKR